MIITVPDPHPGRCLNYRQGNRCLDYDRHQAACTFREDEHDPYGWEFQHRGWQYTPKNPEPWKSPIEVLPEDETPDPGEAYDEARDERAYRKFIDALSTEKLTDGRNTGIDALPRDTNGNLTTEKPHMR